MYTRTGAKKGGDVKAIFMTKLTITVTALQVYNYIMIVSLSI